MARNKRIPAERVAPAASANSHEHRFLLWESTTEHASPEAAFMELTADSVEYLARDSR
ncbi:hypothetical protein [Streptomyces sp. NPDC101776]|uniref:hypothetical protein n=1 Tax=Streptomyces sp. NPDC101776 TaxID=3366146 RepID=UPI0037FCB979